MKILLIRRAALGDTVVTFPLITILREQYKGCYIEVIGDENYWSLAYPKYVDKITSGNSNYINSLYSNSGLPSEITEYFKSFDLIIGFLKDRDSTVKNHFQNMGISNFVFQQPFSGNTDFHITEYTTSVLKKIGIEYYRDIIPCIDLDSSDVLCAENLLKTMGNCRCFVSIHPRTYGIKGLEIDRFLELGRWIQNELGGRTVWILGPVEQENLAVLESNFDKSSVIFINDLKKVAAIISVTDFYIGCDTGITHLAAATGVNTISIFGPTDPDIWGALGKRVRILKTGSLQTFNTGIVKQLILNNIICGFIDRKIILI
jgi:ADP-heptose:LPS heptosyltransferase